MKKNKVNVLGMELDEWEHESSKARFGVGNDFATLYEIKSEQKNKGHATELLKEAKSYYEDQGKRFGGSVALNPTMKHIYQKLGIEEYE